jgi:SAM-dependent methyltransferase
LEGATVLDLGCGAGRDVYVAAQLVGPAGSVIGVDMTDELLAVAKAHEDWCVGQFLGLSDTCIYGSVVCGVAQAACARDAPVHAMTVARGARGCLPARCRFRVAHALR